MSKQVHLKQVAKRAITLIEVMIVMFLIALIAGVVAYNYRGSLESGKVFTTEQNMEKLHNLLDLEAAKQNISDPQFIVDNWEALLKESPLVKNAGELTKDGWGQKFTIENDNQGGYRFKSAQYDRYIQQHPGSKQRG